MPVMVSALDKALPVPWHRQAFNICYLAVMFVQFRPNIVVDGDTADALKRTTCRIGTTTVVSERLTD
jgi:hypothetical protein